MPMIKKLERGREGGGRRVQFYHLSCIRSTLPEHTRLFFVKHPPQRRAILTIPHKTPNTLSLLVGRLSRTSIPTLPQCERESVCESQA